MRAYLKHVGLVHQCKRCFSLRDLALPECVTCREILRVHTTETQPLVMSGIVSDDNPTVPSYGTYTDNQTGGFTA
jgi:hypothetical protein